MKKNISWYLFSGFFSFLLSTFSVRAQQNSSLQYRNEQLKSKLEVYLAEHPAKKLYLHLDKNIYRTDEKIWFKAYLLADTVTDNKVLYVRIANEYKELVVNGQFPMYDIRAHGSLQLNKNLPEGKYTLYAYTDRMISTGDTGVFVQQFRIRQNNTERKLEAEVLVADTAQLIRGGKVQLTARVKESGKPAKSIKGEYELVADGKIIKYGGLTTNLQGETFVSFNYPKQLDDNQSLKVNLLFTKGNDYAELSLDLPHQGSPLQIKCYPEGGKLIAGLAGKVGIEVLDIHQHPVSAEILLKNGEKLIAKTRTNKLGIGSFIFIPEKSAGYRVEVIAGKKKQGIAFPELIEAGGYSLSLHKNKDRVEVTVYNKNESPDALLVLRSNHEMLWSKAVNVASGDSLKVLVPELPKNILSLAVFNAENKPLAERLFLNKEQEDYVLSMSTDQKNYGLRKKVTVTLHIADANGKPAVANLSVAATEKSRIDSADYRTILEHWYYQPFGQQSQNRFLLAKSINAMDELLLTGRWRSKHWDSISTYRSKGLPRYPDRIDDAIGQVIPFGNKKITKFYMKSPEFNIPIMGEKLKNLISYKRKAIEVDENNKFRIRGDELITNKGQEWLLESEPEFDYVRWSDPDIHYDSTIVSGKSLLPGKFSTVSSYSLKSASAFGFNKPNLLNEVVIGTDAVKLRKLGYDCGDLICSACGNLNCPYRPAFKPVKGKIYNMGKGPGVRVTYLGCGNYRRLDYIKNITVPEVFYLPDYSEYSQAKEDTRSTIYWNPNLVTDANGNVTFSFYTSDVIGEFELIAQGLEITTLKPLTGTGSFTVNY